MKVTKRHRGKKSKEEVPSQQLGGVPLQPSIKQIPNGVPPTPRYPMRAREPQVCPVFAQVDL